ncbi:MAG: triphosphoribosyl-dephospho-CoA synthase, partial [Alphaproteobacteria bacterium]|nr:triphosphoribosyl-dephospho-CoA synthase [Alphaproteobacteria bacterium]
MTNSLTTKAMEQLFIDACLTELRSLKPGNVHIFADGHGMTMAQFEIAAKVAAPFLVAEESPLGQRIENAVKASMESIKLNTNLGIILLAAPLIMAAQTAIHVKTPKPTVADLKSSLIKLLHSTSAEDGNAIARAIKLANPGGLGSVNTADVNGPPANLTVFELMQLANSRDRIALQYTTNFVDIFQLGLPRLRDSLELEMGIDWATTNCYLELIGSFPDTHIARKHGEAVAQQVQEAAQAI